MVEALGPGQKLDSVRVVRLMGDRVQWSDFEAFQTAFAPSARFGVALGSTECSSNYAQWFVDAALRKEDGPLPVGRVMPGLSVTVVDEHARPVPGGEVGEFLVSSPFLALGYWREPQLTAKRFGEDPAAPGKRTFRTSDMGRLRPDGLLEFVGRKDDMVKLRGHRVEPAEIETALRGFAVVTDAAVVVHRHEDGPARALVAYVELRPGTKALLPRHMMAMAAQVLPRFMTPSAIFLVDALPRLPNFKIDRQALGKLDAARIGAAVHGREDPLLDQVARVFEQVIQVDGASPEDNLASLGGDSLQVVNLLLELERQFDLKISAARFEEFATIRELAQWIRGRLNRRAGLTATLAPEPAPEPPTAEEIDSLADELAAAAAEQRPAVIPDRDPMWLQMATTRLLSRGALHVGEQLVRQLNAADGEIGWARTLRSVFDEMPPAPVGEGDFADDPASDVQIARRAGCDTVLLAFCGQGHEIGPPMPMMHRWLGGLGASVVYLRDFNGCKYLGGIKSLAADRPASLEALRRIVDQLGGRRILCYGNSAGGFGALDYGLALGADAILCMAGATNLDPDANRFTRSATTARRLRSAFPDATLDLRLSYAAATRPPRTQMVFGEHNWDDRLQAEHLDGLTGVSLHPVDNFAGHAAFVGSLHRNTFDGLLRQFAT